MYYNCFVGTKKWAYYRADRINGVALVFPSLISRMYSSSFSEVVCPNDQCHLETGFMCKNLNGIIYCSWMVFGSWVVSNFRSFLIEWKSWDGLVNCGRYHNLSNTRNRFDYVLIAREAQPFHTCLNCSHIVKLCHLHLGSPILRYSFNILTSLAKLFVLLEQK